MIILVIVIIAVIFRFYGLNWDSGFHLHPDERMITMVAEKITLEDLNPHFFAYGSLPLYLLKATGTVMGQFGSEFAVYTSLNLVGRFLSALFDLGTLAILYLLAKKVFDKKIALLAFFFYAVSVLPIQLSHFYAVDTPLTFFIMLTLFLLIRYLEKPNFNNSLLIGVSFGLAMATKASAILLIVPIFIGFLPKFRHSILHTTYYLLLTTLASLAAFFITMPYALLDFQEFWRQTVTQQEMTKSAFTFPYTLQYVNKIPYLYELKNIFFWGLGPILATLAFIGVIFATSTFFIRKDSRVASLLGMTSLRSANWRRSNLFILLTFFWVYLGVTGSFAIGFMRYMLPLYPLLCLFAAVIFRKIFSFLPHNTYYLILVPFFFWPLAFMQIYTQPNTRLQATDWILQNVPAGKTLAIEHWDDRLPLTGSEKYHILEMPMYDPESSPKWFRINQILLGADYIILASNRLYTPLQKLTDCGSLPPGRCYQQTARYYQALFDGSLGFSKIAEFSILPGFSMNDERLTINDFGADESFTVYDHPKVMIFKKVLW